MWKGHSIVVPRLSEPDLFQIGLGLHCTYSGAPKAIAYPSVFPPSSRENPTTASAAQLPQTLHSPSRNLSELSSQHFPFFLLESRWRACIAHYSVELLICPTSGRIPRILTNKEGFWETRFSFCGFMLISGKLQLPFTW